MGKGLIRFTEKEMQAVNKSMEAHSLKIVKG